MENSEENPEKVSSNINNHPTKDFTKTIIKMMNGGRVSTLPLSLTGDSQTESISFSAFTGGFLC